MTDDRHLDPRYDARLSELISETADSVEPAEGLTAIRSRTRKESPMSTRNSSGRNWLYAVGGAVVGTAAVIVAIAVVSQLNDDDSSTPVAGQTQTSAPDPTKEPSPTDTPSDTPTSADVSATGTPIESAVPVYFAGDGPRGTVLFREFQPGIGADPVAQAAQAAVAGPAHDPDYRSLWPAGTQAAASYDGDVITVDLTGADLHDRPAGMTKRDAELAIQQVVYSVQGAAQARAGVQLLIDGQRTDQVLGSPASEPLTNAKGSDVLSQMSITSPEEGQKVSGTFTASGVNNAFEATFTWELRDSSGQVVANNFGTAEGCCEVDKLFPWTADVDLTGVAPGTYTFVAMNDDPSGGEGKGPDVDTRTIVVE
jgi:hypothetical protein